MTYCYPPLGDDGWHFEAGWQWDTFGVGLCVSLGQAAVFRLGFGYVMLWKFDSVPFYIEASE